MVMKYVLVLNEIYEIRSQITRQMIQLKVFAIKGAKQARLKVFQ